MSREKLRISPNLNRSALAALRRAIRAAGIERPALPQPAALVCDASPGGWLHIQTVQELLGRKDVSTTMIHTQVLNRSGSGCAVRWMSWSVAQ